MNTKYFIYVWEYIVKQDQLEEFISAYGSNGEWVKFFENAEGYIRTELHQDISNRFRFVTVDYWESKESRDSYREENLQQFNDIDARCENLTESEKHIGEFYSI